MTVTVVNKYTTSEPYIYIGRGSVFGNPFPVTNRQNRDAACDRYADYFQLQMDHSSVPLHREVQKLIARHRAGEDLVLGCFCKPQRCHGDTIKKYIEDHS